ncbi:MAG: MFS transporter, partial [Desulfobacteraceae bacterium]
MRNEKTNTASWDPAPKSRRRWAILVVGSQGLVLSMFYRVSTAVISPDLALELNLTSSQLGNLSASFFYAFALSQLPLGMALDRWGPRMVMTILGLLGIAGVSFFALAQTLATAILARVLMGIGMSCNLMGVLALLAAWFPVNRFAFLAGSLVSIGVMGNLLAATPLALLSQWVGWRGSFLVIATLNASVIVAFFLMARDHPAGWCPSEAKKTTSLRGISSLLCMYSYWTLSLNGFVRYGYLVALQGLWAGPFLVYGLGLDKVSAGNAIFCFGLGFLIGLPLCGCISDRVLRSRKKVVMPSLLAFTFLTVSMIWWERGLNHWLIFSSFFAFGFVASPGHIALAHIKELVPVEMTARAMTGVNFFT